MNYIGIRGRIIFLVIISLSLSILITAIMFRQMIYNNVINHKMVVTDIITSSIVHDIKYDLERNNFDMAARKVISKYMTYYRVIDRIQFYNKQGALLVDSYNKQTGNITDNEDIVDAISSARPSITSKKTGKFQLGIQSIYPIIQGSNIIGAIKLDVSVKDLKEILLEVNYNIAITLVIVTFLAAMILFILIRMAILKRLTRLINVTKEISAGNYEIKIKDHRKDEIGKLEAAFNTMAKRINDGQAQLIQSEKMASVGLLSAGVAHEINNPIAFVMNNIEAVRDYFDSLIQISSFSSSLTNFKDNASANILKHIIKLESLLEEHDFAFIKDDYEKVIEQTVNGLKRVQDIVISLKNFTRTGSEEKKLSDINEALESTIKIALLELKSKVEIVKKLEEIPRINCNIGKLNQVFLNLIINSGQAIKSKGEIIIKTWADESWVYISITDNGSGIPEDKIKNIFDPFFTTKEAGVGTGLGLSISYGIIENHGGKISVDSKINEGTTFTIQLPLESLST